MTATSPEFMISSLPDLSIEELVAGDARYKLVLTVNNRQALRLKQLLVQHMGSSASILELPLIMPLGRWVRAMHDARLFSAQGHVPAIALDRFAEQLVWESVIEKEEGAGRLLDLQQTAKMASDAHHLCADWHIQVKDDEITQEYERFRQWQHAYLHRLSQMDAEDDGLMQENLLQALENREPLNLPQQIVLLGFTECSPRLGRLLLACQSNGSDLAVLAEQVASATEVRKTALGDSAAEWETAIAWARQSLMENPRGTYAIVAPDLEEKAPLARRLLAQNLGRHGLAWNVAVGRPLTEWAPVRAAFAWLRLLAQLGSRKQCEVKVLGAALLAGHCSATPPALATMAQYDAKLRQKEEITLAETDVLSLFDQLGSDLSFNFKEIYQRWCLPFQEKYSRTTTDQWAQRIRECLFGLGFPGPGTLSSANFQVCQAFENLLVRFSALYEVGGLLDGLGASALLQRLARQSAFQPQRDKQARLDVLGFLEAEGGRWDAVWILGLTDEVLPASPSPNPFLPVTALRRVNAPRATPEREKSWADEMFQALLQCAPQVSLSWPLMDGEKELRASSLLEDISFFETESLFANITNMQVIKREVEELTDNQAPALSGHRPVSGGMDVLETQARNPLWAFARYRLGARELEDYPQAVSQRVRGIFLHKVMELVWGMLKDWERLAEKHEDGSLEAFVSECVELAAEQELKHDYAAVVQMEKERARRMVMDFLLLELKREPFAVQQLEQDVKWQRAQVNLSLRMDRVDTLADGEQVIIDYKSGSTPSFRQDWSRQTPVNLQLPFYASVMGSGKGNPVAGLLFARLNARQIEIKGIANEDLGIDGLDDRSSWEPAMSWEALLQRWQTVMEQLADDFSAGKAFNRAWRESDLQYCDVKPFLRLAQESEDE
ncbi:PD-(D/E)XK nuclease family protein [Advenella sp. RU8]|uniref:PD-(D/E)XK nuclease family protein n=1 Tax=Advenella sp. RU8 TaxID=3399575 RepID=UPI003AB066B8